MKEFKKELLLEKITKNQVREQEQNFVKLNPKCKKCGNIKNLSYDHIIPRTILINFNIDFNKQFWLENSQTLCLACNQLKAQNLDFTNPKTKELLLKLLYEIPNFL